MIRALWPLWLVIGAAMGWLSMLAALFLVDVLSGGYGRDRRGVVIRQAGDAILLTDRAGHN